MIRFLINGRISQFLNCYVVPQGPLSCVKLHIFGVRNCLDPHLDSDLMVGRLSSLQQNKAWTRNQKTDPET